MDLESRLSWYYGFTLLGAVAALAAAFGLGKVDEAHSYGLHELLLILGVLATNWSAGKFGGGRKPPEPPSEPRQ